MPRRETALLALLLVLTAVLLHVAHYLIFRDLHLLLFYFVLDVAFLPVSVLVLTVLVDRLLAARERADRKHKMNMVVGVFFSEFGRTLLGLLCELLPPGQDVLADLRVSSATDDDQLRRLGREACRVPLDIELEPLDLETLRELLYDHRGLALRLLSNPVLLEHEEFTDMLWAVVHLTEELMARPDLGHLPASDVRHLEGDTQRVYCRLLHQWLEYLAHLKQFYPYLYSFALRADPLAPARGVEVME